MALLGQLAWCGLYSNHDLAGEATSGHVESHQNLSCPHSGSDLAEDYSSIVLLCGIDNPQAMFINSKVNV